GVELELRKLEAAVESINHNLLYLKARFPSMEDEGFDSLEQLNEYKSVASQTFLREEDFYDFYNQYTWFSICFPVILHICYTAAADLI
ncbi:unnamed protein product, partial [Urochloa humidicola]